MATITLTVCDECRDPNRPVRNYRITSEGRVAVRDLCEEHAGPLEALFEQAKPAEPRRRGRRGSTRIATIEEIEREKAARKTSTSDA